MRFSEEGILDSSVHRFAHPSAMAVSHLMVLQSAGYFQVTRQYRVTRLNYSSYLLIAVESGKLCCQSEAESVTAPAGTAVLMDCRKPHAYYAP